MASRTLVPVLTVAALLLFPGTVAFAAHGEDCLGINTHISNDDTYDAVAATGMKWVRIDVNWFQIEPTQGNYNWGDIDRVVNKAGALGLKVLATFGYTPPWASTGNGDGKESGNDVPKPGLYEAALGQTVKHFRGRVAHWGLWNEPNLGGFWEGSAQQYVDLIVKPGSDAIHTQCPECFALGPELANVGDKINEYYDTVFGQAKDKFDIITHHTYQDFPELDSGAGIFSDSFYNALDKKRVFSTRMALQEALAKYGITHKDVWITETGYKASPPTDPGEMDYQKKYYELVLKAQLDRAWYTNTFFYEIEDCGIYIPNCDIDGYGILRRSGGPDSTWQDNFTFKPAYQAIKDWMAAHPGWCSGSPVDAGTPDAGGQDAGGQDAGGGDAGTVAPTILYAVRAPTPLNIDGRLDEWNFKYEAPVTSADYVELTAPTSGDSDLSGRVIAMWDDDYLYLGAIITDNVHKNDHIPTEMWMGDSWQTAFDADFDRTVGQYDNDGDTEVGFAVLAGGPSSAQWKAPNGAPSWNPKFMSGKDAQNHLVFEIGIPWAQLPPFVPAVGKLLGFAYLINDDDGSGRKGFIEWSTGIGISKDPSNFGTLALAGGPCEVDSPCTTAADCAGAQMQCQCGGYWTCNGARRCEWMCGSPPDAGTADTGVQTDAGTKDEGTPDDAAQDAGTEPDGETRDEGTTDAAPDDTGTPDDTGGVTDAGTADGGGGMDYDVQYVPTDAGPGTPIDLTTDSGGCACASVGL
jgi:hypothetical protein